MLVVTVQRSTLPLVNSVSKIVDVPASIDPFAWKEIVESEPVICTPEGSRI
jgi:hypothetical protein